MKDSKFFCRKVYKKFEVKKGDKCKSADPRGRSSFSDSTGVFDRQRWIEMQEAEGPSHAVGAV